MNELIKRLVGILNTKEVTEDDISFLESAAEEIFEKVNKFLGTNMQLYN